jgi:hypothetical protein
MKRFLLISVLLLCVQLNSQAFAYSVYSNSNNLWGIKDSDETILVEPQYTKAISLNDNSFIVQKKHKFGLINPQGEILVPIKYTHAERIFGKYFKAGLGLKYGLYNEYGDEILAPEYSSINILFGGMFLTCKNYKYGIVNSKGETILENKFDDIYMPEPNIMRIKYQGTYYEIEQIKGEDFVFPQDILNSEGYVISEIIENPVASAGYSVVTFTDYLLKLFSSISPAHEQTVDELLLYQGADAISTYIKCSWIPKYPIVFAKNYYHMVKNPTNGPLSEIKSDLKQKI